MLGVDLSQRGDDFLMQAVAELRWVAHRRLHEWKNGKSRDVRNGAASSVKPGGNRKDGDAGQQQGNPWRRQSTCGCLRRVCRGPFEQVAAAPDRSYPMLFVTQRLSDFDQALHEGIVGHGDVPPHRLEELLLRHEAAGVADEVGQDLERPLPQGDLFAIPQQRGPRRIEPELREAIRLIRQDFVHSSSGVRDVCPPARYLDIERGTPMQTSRRPLTVALTLALMAAAATGCGSSPTSPTSPNSPQSPVATGNIAGTAGLLGIGGGTGVLATGATPDDLMARGWECRVPPPYPDRIVCRAPNQSFPSPAVPVDQRPPTFTVLVFQDTGAFIGTQIGIRADLYQGQTCGPTGDPYIFRPPIGYYECLHPAGR